MNRKYQQLVLALAVLISFEASAAHYGAWQAPNPAPGINTAAAEGCPIEAPDGSHLYFMSTRTNDGEGHPTSQGGLDNWRATWNVAMQTWGGVENLGPKTNSAAADYCPTPLPGNRLLFVSSRENSGDCTGCIAVAPTASPPDGDIFLTRENPAHGWATPVNLGGYADGGPNTKGSEYSPSVVETREGTFLYFSSNGYPGSKSHDIYVSRQRADGTFGPGVRVDELSSDAADVMPNVRRDGLEIVFSSNRGNATPFDQDIYYATRPNTASPWQLRGRVPSADPRKPVNTSGSETRATLSADGTRLYFGRKVDSTDKGDVYFSRRSKR